LNNLISTFATHKLQLKTAISYILLFSFVFQLGKSAALDHVALHLYSKICSCCTSEDNSFFDAVFADVYCEGQEKNEEQTQKNSGSDLFITVSKNFACNRQHILSDKMYLVYASLLHSGFYFSLIQPPD